MNLDEPTIVDDPGRAPIAPGTQVGSYRIESRLGEGGMGTVYRAFDTRLNRPVAIKFLSDSLADASARRRFQREAQTASSLNHPHILTVFDVGDFDGRQYIVTEFVDGGTLKDWARTPKRSWRDVVEALTGVADGLATAHNAGILHRDIKPANVLVASNGYAKLADFGLAKLTDDKPASEETRTLTDKITRQGLIVGTVAYMSPEQAMGNPLDARSDIFSFGVLLYEMLAGSRPFGGPTDLEVLKSVIHGAVPPLSGEIPAPLRTAVERALAKDVAGRYQSMSELTVDLRRIGRGELRAARPRVKWLLAAAVAALLAAVGLWLLIRPGASADDPLAGITPVRITDFPGTETGAALSPDGRAVVFASDRDGPLDVFVGVVGSNDFRNLTKGSFQAFPSAGRPAGFTPDGQNVWIVGPPPPTNRMVTIPVGGGERTPFLHDKTVNVDWSPDGKNIVYYLNPPGDPMFVADSDGSNPHQIYIDEEGLHNHFPIWSTDGKWIYFTHGFAGSARMDIWRISRAGGQPERLTSHNGAVGYPTPIDERTVLYVAEDATGGPWLWSLDVERKTTHRIRTGVERYTSIAASGDRRKLVAAAANPRANLWSVPILDHTAEPVEIKPYQVPTTRALAPRFGGGALFYLSSLDGGDGLWVVRDGKASEIWKGTEGAIYAPPAVSPDAGRVAIVLKRNGKQSLRIVHADGSAEPFIDSIDAVGAAAWSPNGEWIVVGGDDGTGPGLFKIPANGRAPMRLVRGNAFNPVWSATRPLIVYSGPNVAAEAPLRAVSPDGEPVDFPKITCYGEGSLMRFTPDGNSLVYVGTKDKSVDFLMLDLDTKAVRSLAHVGDLDKGAFDITPDGKQIVFDRRSQNSDLYVFDLKK